MLQKRLLSSFLVVLLSLVVFQPAFAAKNMVKFIPFATRPFTDNDVVKLDEDIVEQGWQSGVEAPEYGFEYTPENLKEHWPTIMRAIRAPYPSADYLKEFYGRYPEMYEDVSDKAADWHKLSNYTLKVWADLFNGKFKDAYDYGHVYGGVARTPALFAEALQAIYLTRSKEQRNHMLQEVGNYVGIIARKMDFKKMADLNPADFIRLRLAYVYATGRAVEDASVLKMGTSSGSYIVVDMVNKLLEYDPDHALGLALQGSLDANAIRRVGKIGGKIAVRSDSEEAKQKYEDALKAVGDMAVLRFEYANSMLYIDGNDSLDQAILNLWIASNTEATSAMEELDRLYAEKRLKEIKSVKKKQQKFKSYDKSRYKYLKKNGINPYCLCVEPFIMEE